MHRHHYFFGTCSLALYLTRKGYELEVAAPPAVAVVPAVAVAVVVVPAPAVVHAVAVAAIVHQG